MKKLSAEGRFEAGIDEAFAGKLWAFVPVFQKAGGKPYVGLGIAVANEHGFSPVPLHWVNGQDYNEMMRHADELNLADGKSPSEAWNIIGSSMVKPAV